jgi:hypothetical protein
MCQANIGSVLQSYVSSMIASDVYYFEEGNIYGFSNRIRIQCPITFSFWLENWTEKEILVS